jgi:hypothetical protein
LPWVYFPHRTNDTGVGSPTVIVGQAAELIFQPPHARPGLISGIAHSGGHRLISVSFATHIQADFWMYETLRLFSEQRSRKTELLSDGAR